MKRYELLENFTGVYFSQDADLFFGETDAEIRSMLPALLLPA